MKYARSEISRDRALVILCLHVTGDDINGLHVVSSDDSSPYIMMGLLSWRLPVGQGRLLLLLLLLFISVA